MQQHLLTTAAEIHILAVMVAGIGAGSQQVAELALRARAAVASDHTGMPLAGIVPKSAATT